MLFYLVLEILKENCQELFWLARLEQFCLDLLDAHVPNSFSLSHLRLKGRKAVSGDIIDTAVAVLLQRREGLQSARGLHTSKFFCSHNKALALIILNSDKQ